MEREVLRLMKDVAARQPLGEGGEAARWVHRSNDIAPQMYAKYHAQQGIDFTVERIAFSGAQTMEPRIVRIAPGRCNERHRHAHETLLLVLEGQGTIQIGDSQSDVAAGDMVFIPRWRMHQATNTDGSQELVILAITDFLLTAAVLGDYARPEEAAEEKVA